MVEEVKICQNMLVPPSCAWHGRQRVSSSLTSRKLVLTVGPTLDLLSVHGIGASKVLKLIIDLEGIGVGLTLVLPSVHGMDASKYYYCITSWCKAVTNELVWFGIKTVGVPLSYYWHTLVSLLLGSMYIWSLLNQLNRS